MGDLSALLANSAATNANFDFGSLNKSYWEGLDQNAKNGLRDAFKPTAANPDGVPMKDGQVDLPSVMKTLFQKGDVAGGVGLIGASNGMQDRAMLAGITPQQPQAPIVGPATGRNTVQIEPGKRDTGGTEPQAQPQAASGKQPATVMAVLAAQGIPNHQLGAASESIARQLGVSPTDPLDLNDPQVRNVLAPAVAQLKRNGVGEVVPQGQPAPQPPQGSFQPSPQQAAAQDDPTLKRLTFLAASPDKNTAAAAKVRLESYLKDKEATTEMKNAGASGMNLPQYQEKQGELAAQQAGATERAKADVKEQQEYIAGGKSAAQRLTTLNAISNVVNGDKAPGMGYAGDTELKVKMALQRMGFDFGDLSGAELMQKMNASLASEMSRTLTARPTQFEFKTFLGNNPGLLLDKSGNQRLIGIFSQLAKREVDLGKLARQHQDNWENWDGVVEKYDAEKSHQIIDPISKQPIYTNSIVAPGGQKPQGGQPARFASPSDVHAAIAAGKLKKGDSFEDANGKTRFVP